MIKKKKGHNYYVKLFLLFFYTSKVQELSWRIWCNIRLRFWQEISYCHIRVLLRISLGHMVRFNDLSCLYSRADRFTNQEKEIGLAILLYLSAPPFPSFTRINKSFKYYTYSLKEHTVLVAFMLQIITKTQPIQPSSSFKMVNSSKLLVRLSF